MLRTDGSGTALWQTRRADWRLFPITRTAENPRAPGRFESNSGDTNCHPEPV